MNENIIYLLGLITIPLIIYIWDFIDRNILGNRCCMGMTTYKAMKEECENEQYNF